MAAQTCYKVIIIGGGAAGLAAADKLIQNGIKNFILLEAQDKLGGRICSVPHGDHFLEYGAHWVHGEEGNVVYSIGNDNLLLDKENSLKQTGTGETKFVREDSSFVDEEMVNLFYLQMETIKKDVEQEISVQKRPESLGNYYTNKFLGMNKFGKVGLELLDWYGRFQCCVDGSDTWFEPSIYGSTVYQDCPGNIYVNWSEGYKSLVNYFKNKLPNENIRLQSPVKKVIWKNLEVNKPYVDVVLSSGEILRGEHVILTPSLAVLKTCYEDLFEPQLPSKKIKAIKALGMDVVDKIYLEFPTNWWGNFDGFNFLRETLVCEFGQENWENGILGFFEVYNQPQMLCAWLTGSAAKEMEKCNKENVKNKCMGLLKKYLGSHYDIPEPIWWDRTQWYSNPFIRGGYSFRSVMSEVTNSSAEDLAYPLCSDTAIPLVCFAGEATHDKFYSTVHGAVESGWREANRITSYLK